MPRNKEQTPAKPEPVVKPAISTPRGRNEAIVVDKDENIIRIYANEDDGKRERKYPHQVCKPFTAKGVADNGQSEREYSYDGVRFPAYTVAGPKFAEMAEGFCEKLNYKSLEKGSDGLLKRHGYKHNVNPIVCFEYQDVANRTSQIVYKPVRPYKVIFK